MKPQVEEAASQPAHKVDEKKRTVDITINEEADFNSLLLSDKVLAGLHDAGFERPSPIQLEAIPYGKCGLDLICQAKSGTGKTCVFAVIALEAIKLDVSKTQVLVVAPTREIAYQIKEVISAIGCKFKGLQCEVFIGGMSLESDISKLGNCHIAVGTPGRLKSLIEEKHLLTDSIRLFVLDEADKLLEKDTRGSLEEQINWIYSTLPTHKQVLALSATYPESLAKHLHNYMTDPKHIRISVDDLTLKGVKQYHAKVFFHPLPNKVFDSKVELLKKILGELPFQQCMIFSNYQSRAEHLNQQLNKAGWPSTFIAGSQNQQVRLRAMDQLKKFHCRILISTDLTARGIDCDKVNLIINLDLPWDTETYLHRVGRAGRFGSYGLAISFVAEGEEMKKLEGISCTIGRDIPALPDDLEGVYDPYPEDEEPPFAATEGLQDTQQLKGDMSNHSGHKAYAKPSAACKEFPDQPQLSAREDIEEGLLSDHHSVSKDNLFESDTPGPNLQSVDKAVSSSFSTMRTVRFNSDEIEGHGDTTKDVELSNSASSSSLSDSEPGFDLPSISSFLKNIPSESKESKRGISDVKQDTHSVSSNLKEIHATSNSQFCDANEFLEKENSPPSFFSLFKTASQKKVVNLNEIKCSESDHKVQESNIPSLSTTMDQKDEVAVKKKKKRNFNPMAVFPESLYNSTVGREEPDGTSKPSSANGSDLSPETNLTKVATTTDDNGSMAAYNESSSSSVIFKRSSSDLPDQAQFDEVFNNFLDLSLSRNADEEDTVTSSYTRLVSKISDVSDDSSTAFDLACEGDDEKIDDSSSSEYLSSDSVQKIVNEVQDTVTVNRNHGRWKMEDDIEDGNYGWANFDNVKEEEREYDEFDDLQVEVNDEESLLDPSMRIDAAKQYVIGGGNSYSSECSSSSLSSEVDYDQLDNEVLNNGFAGKYKTGNFMVKQEVLSSPDKDLNEEPFVWPVGLGSVSNNKKQNQPFKNVNQLGKMQKEPIKMQNQPIKKHYNSFMPPLNHHTGKSKAHGETFDPNFGSFESFSRLVERAERSLPKRNQYPVYNGQSHQNPTMLGHKIATNESKWETFDHSSETASQEESYLRDVLCSRCKCEVAETNFKKKYLSKQKSQRGNSNNKPTSYYNSTDGRVQPQDQGKWKRDGKTYRQGANEISNTREERFVTAWNQAYWNHIDMLRSYHEYCRSFASYR